MHEFPEHHRWPNSFLSNSTKTSTFVVLLRRSPSFSIEDSSLNGHGQMELFDEFDSQWISSKKLHCSPLNCFQCLSRVNDNVIREIYSNKSALQRCLQPKSERLISKTATTREHKPTGLSLESERKSTKQRKRYGEGDDTHVSNESSSTTKSSNDSNCTIHSPVEVNRCEERLTELK